MIEVFLNYQKKRTTAERETIPGSNLRHGWGFERVYELCIRVIGKSKSEKSNQSLIFDSFFVINSHFLEETKLAGLPNG